MEDITLSVQFEMFFPKQLTILTCTANITVPLYIHTYINSDESIILFLILTRVTSKHVGRPGDKMANTASAFRADGGMFPSKAPGHCAGARQGKEREC